MKKYLLLLCILTWPFAGFADVYFDEAKETLRLFYENDPVYTNVQAIETCHPSICGVRWGYAKRYYAILYQASAGSPAKRCDLMLAMIRLTGTPENNFLVGQPGVDFDLLKMSLHPLVCDKPVVPGGGE